VRLDHEAGTVPDRELSESIRVVRDARLAHDDGAAPLNWFVDRISFWSVVRLPNTATLPLNWFFCKLRKFSAVRLLREDGSAPMSELKDRSRCVRAVREPKEDGSEPV